MTPPADSHAALRPPAWADELERLDAAIAATPTPAMGVALGRISRAANHSRLFLGCTALLAACGGARAAENGLASIALTSAVVNLVLKPLGNRRRPDRQIHDVPVTRQVAMPRSTSWPSGHSASAFASGVSAAWPQAGIPLSVVASLVAYSRVHTGVHYPSDTIAGRPVAWALAPVAVAALRRRRSARVDVQGSPARSLLNSQKYVTTAHPRNGDPRPMTPPATAVASDVQFPARPASRRRIARRSAPATYFLSRNAASPVDFRLPHEPPITMGWQVPL